MRTANKSLPIVAKTIAKRRTLITPHSVTALMLQAHFASDGRRMPKEKQSAGRLNKKLVLIEEGRKKTSRESTVMM